VNQLLRLRLKVCRSIQKIGTHRLAMRHSYRSVNAAFVIHSVIDTRFWVEKREAFVNVYDAAVFINSTGIISYHAQLKISVSGEFSKSIACLQVVVEIRFGGSV